VLIVADDVSVTDAFSRALRLDGFEVWAALSGTEALRLAGKHLPQTVLIDLRMPLSGVVDLLRRLRAVPGLEEAALGVVSGDQYASEAQRKVAELGAAVRFKPFWLDELVTLARHLMVAPVRD
jgi:two-component system OmpR family response regulator